MFKKILILMMGLVFALCLSGLSFAQIPVTAGIDQSSPGGNDAYIEQNHNGVGYGPFIIDITQISTTSTNWADSRQKGTAQTATIWQSATGSNTSITEQGTPGVPGGYAYDLTIDVHQTANGGDNYALILQKYTAYSSRWNDFRIKQIAGTYNWAEMTGETIISAITGNKLAVDQDATIGSNTADLYVDYMNNEVVGADNTGTPQAFPDPATQISDTGNNELYVNQSGYFGGHMAGLYQDAAGDNYADIDQSTYFSIAGISNNNSLGVHQVAGTGKNDLYADQDGNGTAKVVQNAATDNFSNVSQNSSADLVGADVDATINPAKPANQISTTADNTLWTSQSGDNNEIGLYQPADDYNYADIKQTGDDNSLGVYQYAPNDYNTLDVTQYGDVDATVAQTSDNGYNDLFISQSAGSSAIVDQTATAGNNTVTINQ